MILNILNAPAGTTAHADCLRLLTSGDALILIEDGVFAAVESPQNAPWLAACPGGVQLYLLREDLNARGLAGRQSGRFQVIGYDDFVDLVTQHPLSQSWF